MEAETKFIAPRMPLFVALMQAPELAGYHLEPMPAVSVQDVYLDTAHGDLLRQNHLFRVREQGGEVIATLKSLGGAEGSLHRRLELEAALGGPVRGGPVRGGPVRGGRLPIIPEGPLRRQLDRLVGDAPLSEIVRLRQQRTPRVAFDGARLVGVLSLDVVAHEADGALHVTNEVEIELAATGREDDLYRLDPVLRQWGLEPTPLSKFERALLRQPRSAGRPVLLLPDERAALVRFQESGTPLHRRRARVMLLAAQGLRPGTIANKVGLSTARVLHWMQAFRERRLAIFEAVFEAAGREEPTAQRRAAPRYRVSELVSAGTDAPAVFAREHIPADGPPLRDRGRASEEWPSFSLPPAHAGPGEAPPAMRIRDEDLAAERIPMDRLPSGALSFLALNAGGDGHRPIPAGDDSEEEFARVSTPENALDLFETPLEVSPDELPPIPAVAPGTAAEDDVDLTQGAALTEDAESALEPAPLAVAGTAARPELSRTATERPLLHADDAVLPAAEKVLRYQAERFATSARRMLDERDAPSVRRLLIAAHRIRIALELFADYLPPRAVKRLHRGLRGTARALDALGDLDLVRAHVADARTAADPEEQAALDAVLSALDEHRASAMAALEARFGSNIHAQWLQRFERLPALLRGQSDAGLLVGDHTREVPDDYLADEPERPQRTRLQHVLGSTLWDRYETLRTYDAVVGEGAAALYPLGVACSALQFALGLTAGCCAEDVREATRPLGQVESHLMLLHHARVAADALAPYTHAAPVAALAGRLRALAEEAHAEVPAQWAQVKGDAFRQALGRVVASIGAE